MPRIRQEPNRSWSKDEKIRIINRHLIDGLSTESIGRLWSGQECLVPCTAQGIMRLLPEDLSGKSVSIINRSNLIGKPLIKLLLDRNATPTIFHSKSGGYGDIVNEAIWSDYVITGTGQAKWIKCYENEWSDVTIIDAAICRDEENKFLVEGEHLVEEAFRAGVLLEVVQCEDYNGSFDVETTYVTYEVIKKLSNTQNPQRIIGVCKKIEEKEIESGTTFNIKRIFFKRCLQ